MNVRARGMVTFAPVRPQTAFEETLGRLQGAIKLGLLPPGSRLPAERDLCTQMGISRSTLRQALTTLTELGYLHATRGRGGGTFVVDEPPPRPVPDAAALAAWRDVCNERLGIELGAAVLASNKADEQSLAPLRRIAKRLEEIDDYDRYCQLDRQFHIAIAELTRSQRLTIAATRVQSSIYDLLGGVDDPSDSMERSEEGHQALLTALAVNDQNAAVEAMCGHLSDTVAMLEDQLRPLPAAG